MEFYFNILLEETRKKVQTISNSLIMNMQGPMLMRELLDRIPSKEGRMS